MRLYGALAVGVLIIALAGCGGRGGGSGTSMPSSVTVDWPTRGRDVSGPSSALSCRFTLHAQSGNAADLVILGDRPAGTAAVNSTYRASASESVGLWQLSGRFYPVAGEVGTPVGTVDQQVRIQKDGSITMPDGSPLDVTFSPVIQSVQVDPNQSVMVGATTSLTASAYDGNGGLVVVTPGSFVFARTSSEPQPYLSVPASGFAVGLRIGSDSVVVSIDGITSDQQAIAVTPAMRTIAIDSADIDYDPSRDTLWVVGGFSSYSYAGQAVPVNATTGAIGTPPALSDFGLLVAVSPDSTYLYVAGYSGTVERVVLATGGVDETIQLPSGTIATQMIPLPGPGHSLAVALVNVSDGQTDQGTVIYDGTTPRPNVALIGQSIAINDDGSKLYGYQRFQDSNSFFTTANVDSTGLTGVNSQVTAIQGFGNRIHWASEEILADDGTILNPNTLQPVGTLNFPTVDHVAAPIAGTSLTYYIAWDPVQVLEFDLGSLHSGFGSSLGPIPGGIDKAIDIGGNRVAFRTFGATPNAVYILRGLPN